MLLRNLEDTKEYFASVKGVFAGVGVTAYSRFAPGFFISPYHLLASRKTGDLELLRKKAQVFCLEEEEGRRPREETLNSAGLLTHPLAKQYLARLSGPKYILPYQSYASLESEARSMGWRLLASPFSLRSRLGGRGFFREICERLGLRVIPGGIVPFGEFFERSYSRWSSAMGNRFVIQLPDVMTGGGKGTFFVNSPSEYAEVCRFLKDRTWRGFKLRAVSVRRFMDGVPASVALCVTRHGILVSGLQRQLLDLFYCRGIPERGVFCGHAWGWDAWSPDLRQDALEQAMKIGRFLGEQGYRGIAGVDFLLDTTHEQAHAIEINPRLTGAFPMLSLLHMREGLAPMEAFHMLEFLDLPYEADPEELNDNYARPVKGSHLLLFRPPDAAPGGPHPPMSGLYDSLDDGGIRFQRGALGYQEIENDGQFLFVEGPASLEGGNFLSEDPLLRVGRLLFPFPVIGKEGALSCSAEKVVRWLYARMTGRSEGSNSSATDEN